MELRDQISDHIWAKYQAEALQERRRFQEFVSEGSSHERAVGDLSELACAAFARAGTRMVEGAKLIWLMTGGNYDPEKRKQQVSLKLRAELETQAKYLAKTAASGLNKKAAKVIRRGTLEAISSLLSDLVNEFESTENPIPDRTMVQRTSANKMGYTPRAKILFLTADPRRTSSGSRPSKALNLDVEYREIQRSIQAATYRDQLELIACFATTPQELLDALNRHRPKVVHFAGHGSASDGIQLEDDFGHGQLVGPDFLLRIFSTLASDIRVVVLNACHSERQAAAIASSIDITIGTASTLGDDAAVRFSGAFYGALANGLTVEAAFQQADSIISNVECGKRPVLHHRAHVDPKFSLAKSGDSEIFEPFVLALSRAAKNYFPIDPTLLITLTKASQLLEALTSARFNPKFALPPGAMDGFNKLPDLIEQEATKGTQFLADLEKLERRWFRHFSERAASKLTQLEQALSDQESRLQDLAHPIRRFLSEYGTALAENSEISAQDHRSPGMTFLGLLSTFRDGLITDRRLATVHYNQLLEVLPLSEAQALRLEVSPIDRTKNP